MGDNMKEEILKVSVFGNDIETLELIAFQSNELQKKQEKLNALFSSIIEPTELYISTEISGGYNTELTAEIIGRALLDCKQPVQLRFKLTPLVAIPLDLPFNSHSNLNSDSDSDSDSDSVYDSMRLRYDAVNQHFEDTLLAQLKPGTFPFGTKIYGLSENAMAACLTNDKFHQPVEEFIAGTQDALGHDIDRHSTLTFANGMWRKEPSALNDKSENVKPSPSCC